MSEKLDKVFLCRFDTAIRPARVLKSGCLLYIDIDIWEDNSSGSFNGNLCEFTPLNTNIYNGHLILSLTDINQQIACNEITGDIDYDYQTNVVDIVFLVNAILYNSNLEICQKLSSDMDFNNILDIVDIISLINYILNN